MIIFVDNPRDNKETRDFSRQILLSHLKDNCQDIYRPRNLDKLNRVLKESNSDVEELEKYYLQESQNKKIDVKEIVKVSSTMTGLATAVLALISTAHCKIM